MADEPPTISHDVEVLEDGEDGHHWVCHTCGTEGWYDAADDEGAHDDVPPLPLAPGRKVAADVVGRRRMPPPRVDDGPPFITCPTCLGSGIESTYWGQIVHGNWGTLAVDGEHHLDVPVGARFYGGSSHHQCRTCRGSGYA